MVARELETSTKDYWRIAMLFRQGVGKTLTTSQAIQQSGNAAYNVGPHRQVRYRLINLQDSIIQGRPKKKSPAKSSTIHVVQFKG